MASYEDKTDPGVAAHGLDEGVHRAAEFQVAAQADGHIRKSALQLPDCLHVKQRLRGMLMAAVSGVDDRNRGVVGCHGRGALLRMANGCDVSKARDDADGVGNGLALGGGGDIAGREADDASAEIQHRSFMGQPCAGAGFKEQSCEFSAVTDVGILPGICLQVVCQQKELTGFFNSEVLRCQEMAHASSLWNETRTTVGKFQNRIILAFCGEGCQTELREASAVLLRDGSVVSKAIPLA